MKNIKEYERFLFGLQRKLQCETAHPRIWAPTQISSLIFSATLFHAVFSIMPSASKGNISQNYLDETYHFFFKLLFKSHYGQY